MGNRYLVVSDLHLADVEDHADGWMAHKGSKYVFDEEFDELVRDFVSRSADGDQLTLILNGDIFDFDLVALVPDDPPWPVSRAERQRGLDPTEDKSAWKLERVLDDHRTFLATLASFISRGHQVVLTMGNHDRELYFPRVEKVFVDALEEVARELEISLMKGSITFEPWFFYVPGEIYAEHGGQYDHYTSFKYQLAPEIELDGEQMLALPMGDLSNRWLLNRMGFFNPHTGDFILNFVDYALHWFRHYAFSKRGLVLVWLFGSLRVMAACFAIKKKLRRPSPRHMERLQQVARRYDLSQEEIFALGLLQRKPITQRFYYLVRELWIDRLFIALLMIGGTIALALVPIPLWIKLMVPLSSFPLLMFIYEWLTKGETIFTIEREIPKRARAVSRMLPARVITFGHTHVPRQVPLTRDTNFVDTGTWAPLTTKTRPRRLKQGFRNYLQVSFDRKEVSIILGSWMDGHDTGDRAAEDRTAEDRTEEHGK